MAEEIDIQENKLYNISHDLLNALLKDHTTSTEGEQHNIFWATSDYESLGKGYEYKSPILPELITGINGNVVMPRILKQRDTQTMRSREMAEVFTPAWVCNAQNNLIDNEWFERQEVFNKEITTEDGKNTWITNHEKVTFPDGKSWKDYVRDIRLEITCGEAPYIVSRYDTTTGEVIPIENRIGLLDRKLRVINENTTTTKEWLEAAQDAYKSIYAYEWQGDNLLLAREAMLFSFIEYFQDKFGKRPNLRSIKYIAYIISWNVWQMDGLKGVIPDSCGEKVTVYEDLFETVEKKETCKGCKENNLYKHNGIYCIIKDWRTSIKSKEKIRFIDLIQK